MSKLNAENKDSFFYPRSRYYGAIKAITIFKFLSTKLRSAK
ncbi:hypothetical protein [Nostoc sp. FACHB-110]|nr:hypothetical protein [Nostoc sp. FACHB-110]